ncbi:MAG: hypothetical protein A2Z01_05060 [Betaproteobacteria bacterium RBG_16_58_11]|nr:MAG: hypothetical protein A2Z01_05060 [Betaproteobacteria bacterium RBG_16_58_11]
MAHDKFSFSKTLCCGDHIVDSVWPVIKIAPRERDWTGRRRAPGSHNLEYPRIAFFELHRADGLELTVGKHIAIDEFDRDAFLPVALLAAAAISTACSCVSTFWLLHQHAVAQLAMAHNYPFHHVIPVSSGAPSFMKQGFPCAKPFTLVLLVDVDKSNH